VQFLGNVVEEGNCHRGSIGTDWKGDGASLIGAFPPNVKWPFSQSYVYRDNEIKSNGSLFVSVKNALVENNTVRYSDVGIASRRYQDSMFVSGNVFDKVERPYVNLSGARIHPEYKDGRRDEFIERLENGKFNVRKRGDVRQAFSPVFRAQPWNRNMRLAVFGHCREKFELPVEVSFGGVLSGDVESVSVSVPSSGGWDFGGEVKLAKKGNAFAGKMTVVPPKEGPVGMFSWAVEMNIAGDGWRCSLPLDVSPLVQNRFLSWEVAFAKPGEKPREWRRLRWLEGMDGHETMIPAKVFGEKQKGHDLYFRTRIEVFEPTAFSFTRGDWTTFMNIDGKTVFAPGVNTTTAVETTLEKGVHTIELMRPQSSRFFRRESEGVFLRCTFPEGCRAGDWVQR
jgi:hypothetical protein